MTNALKLQHASLAAVLVLVSACTAVSKQVPGAQLGDKPVNQSLAQAGAAVYRDNGCHICHAFGRVLAGPDLAGIMERRDPDWTRKWLKETAMMLESDPQAQAMLKQWKGVRMPEVDLDDRQIEALFHYMAQETARVRATEG
jgi:mono/diheme cytochrome c family protein